MELRYHTDASTFYGEDGSLEPEPKESLAELEKMYNELGQKYHELTVKLEEVKKKYSVKIMDYDGTFKTVVDYEWWEQEDSDSFWTYGLAEFNGSGLIDSLEYKIDLKILHMNKKGDKGN